MTSINNLLGLNMQKDIFVCLHSGRVQVAGFSLLQWVYAGQNVTITLGNRLFLQGLRKTGNTLNLDRKTPFSAEPDHSA